MSNRGISLWVDERWYAAINRQLKDETLEEHLETVIDELCDQLPEHVYERISSEIWEEQKQARLEQVAGILTGSRLLCADDISFSEDIVQKENCLEFYMDVAFAAEDVFGFPAYAEDSDDWLNIYANYDMEHRRVCDTLEVFLVHGDGSEQDYKYCLSEEEQALLLPKMEDYCQQQTGMSLADYSAQCMAEDMAPPIGPAM